MLIHFSFTWLLPTQHMRSWWSAMQILIMRPLEATSFKGSGTLSRAKEPWIDCLTHAVLCRALIMSLVSRQSSFPLFRRAYTCPVVFERNKYILVSGITIQWKPWVCQKAFVARKIISQRQFMKWPRHYRIKPISEAICQRVEETSIRCEREEVCYLITM